MVIVLETFAKLAARSCISSARGLMSSQPSAASKLKMRLGDKNFGPLLIPFLSEPSQPDCLK